MPLSTNLNVMIWVFFALLVFFHLVLVLPKKMTKVSWKMIDYVWLILAALGLIGAVGQSRQIAAKWNLNDARSHVSSNESLLKDELNTLAKPDGAICKKFEQSPLSLFSPIPSSFSQTSMSLEINQHEYDDACQWFQAVAKEYNNMSADDVQNGRVSPLPEWKGAIDMSLLQSYLYVGQLYYQYTQARALVSELDNQSRPKDNEEMMLVLFPYLLSFAVALRLTKVTGEILIEKGWH